MTNAENKNKWEELKIKSEKMEKEKTTEIEEAHDESRKEEAEEQENKLEHPSYEELEQKLNKAESLVHQYWDEVLRAKAEAENFQRRAERDIANAHKYSLEKIASALLPVVDNLERCLENKARTGDELVKNIYTGVELTLKSFIEVLQRFEIKQLNPMGEMFNPEFHAAMTIREEPGARPNTVLQVMQKGYILKDRLIRPALVVVAK